MNWEALRPGQRQAVRVIMGRYVAGEPYTAIILPTRYGKTDVARVATHQLWADGHLSVCLFLSPNEVLRDQANERKRWATCLSRYSLDGSGFKKRVLAGLEVNFTGNGEAFVSSTLQLVNRNVDVFTKWVTSVIHMTGKPPLIVVDECHTGSEDNSWGGTVALLAKAGAKVVLMTATAHRSDGKRIPGFEFKVESQKEVQIHKVTEGSRPELIRIEMYEGLKSVLRLIAHHETTFQQAWAEDPCPICKVETLPFDVDLSRIERHKAEREMLSKLSPSQSAKALGRVVRSPVVIREGVTRALQVLQTRRAFVKDTALIVFCGNDSDKDDFGINQHASKIRKEIERIAPELNVVIATSADSGKQKIQAFADGHGDVLIVKQMASVGLDVERLKVALDLSPIRTPAAFIQRLMRIATPYGGINTCCYVSPDDVRGAALFRGMVKDQNGAATAVDLALVEAWEQERKDPKDDPIYGINDVQDADFEDSQGNYAEAERLPVVQQWLALVPQLSGVLTHAEIAKIFENITLVYGTPQQEHRVVDTGEEMDRLREDIVEMAKEITNHRMGPVRSDGEYGEIIRDVYLRVYRVVGLAPGVRLTDVNELPLLRKIRDQMAREMAIVMENAN